MSKNLTEIVFLMDRSGSMHAVMEEAVAGFNGFVEEQKAILHISATLERQFRDDLNTATAVLEHKNGGI